MSSLPPKGCRDEDLLRLIDLCPFLASEKRQYDDNAVLTLLQKNPQAACLRHSYRCGIGNTTKVHPLALAVALGGSLQVIELMVLACPQALEEKLSGRRNILHYAIAEGVNDDIIQFLTSQNPCLVSEVDSFQAIPLHLASTYPASSPAVLRHLLRVHPEGAKSLDHRSQTPLHRACRCRDSLEKVLTLVEAYPEALYWEDRQHSLTPLGWAERIDHRLSDPIPEVVEMLQQVEGILTLGSSDNDGRNEEEECHDAQQILRHFQSIPWWGGIRMLFSRNVKLVSLLNVPIGLLPELLALIGSGDNINTSSCLRDNDNNTEGREEPSLKYKMESVFSVLLQCPDVVGGQ